MSNMQHKYRNKPEITRAYDTLTLYHNRPMDIAIYINVTIKFDCSIIITYFASILVVFVR